MTLIILYPGYEQGRHGEDKLGGLILLVIQKLKEYFSETLNVYIIIT